MTTTTATTSTTTPTPDRGAANDPGAVATALYTSIATDDGDGAARLLHPDVVLHVPGDHPLGGEHRGPSAVLAFIAGSRALTDDGEHIEPIDLLVGQHHAAMYCRVTATRGSRSLDNTTVHLVRVERGVVTDIWLHNWDDTTVNEFWS